MESLLFFLSSFVVICLVYFKFSTVTLQQLTVGLLLILLLLITLKFSSANKSLNSILRFIFTFLSALLVQILVISSGGFYSPFLILLHLYTLAASFLLNLGAAITFLIFSIMTLILMIFLDPNLYSLFLQDPATGVLYFISFIVIIPLAQYLMRTYHIKDSLNQLMSEYIYIRSSREKSILEGLNDLVIITDENLRIISISEAIEKFLNKSTADIFHQNMLSLFRFQDQQGKILSSNDLGIDFIKSDKTSRTVNDIFLIDLRKKPQRIKLQIRPITNSKDQVIQLVFLLSRAHEELKGDSITNHPEIDNLLRKHEVIIKTLKKTLTDQHLPQYNPQLEILNHLEQDLTTFLELKDHDLVQKLKFLDIVKICKEQMNSRMEFAQAMGVLLDLDFPKDKDTPFFSAPVDSQWLTLIVQKLLDLAILISSKRVKIQLKANKEIVIVDITTNFISQKHQVLDILEVNYGSLNNLANLKWGSGLEGLIAKTLASKLGLNLIIDTDMQFHMAFHLNIPRQAISVVDN